MAVDRDGSGHVEPKELAAALERLGAGMTAADMAVLHGAMDADGSGRLSYREFMDQLGGGGGVGPPPMRTSSYQSERQFEEEQRAAVEAERVEAVQIENVEQLTRCVRDPGGASAGPPLWQGAEQTGSGFAGTFGPAGTRRRLPGTRPSERCETFRSKRRRTRVRA